MPERCRYPSFQAWSASGTPWSAAAARAARQLGCAPDRLRRAKSRPAGAVLGPEAGRCNGLRSLVEISEVSLTAIPAGIGACFGSAKDGPAYARPPLLVVPRVKHDRQPATYRSARPSSDQDLQAAGVVTTSCSPTQTSTGIAKLPVPFARSLPQSSSTARHSPAAACAPYSSGTHWRTASGLGGHQALIDNGRQTSDALLGQSRQAALAYLWPAARPWRERAVAAARLMSTSCSTSPGPPAPAQWPPSGRPGNDRPANCAASPSASSDWAQHLRIVGIGRRRWASGVDTP